MESTHHRLIDFVRAPIKPFDIKIAGSCDGATVGPSFFVCGTFSAPDVDACKCTITANGQNPMTVQAHQTVGNQWKSSSFSGVPPTDWQLTATGRKSPGMICDGSTDGPYTLHVQVGGANTCCVSATTSTLQREKSKANPSGMDVSALAALITCQTCTNHRITVTVDNDQLPDVIVGGAAPEKGRLRVFFGSEQRELLVKIEEGTWQATLGTLAANQEYSLVATAGEGPKERLLLKIRRGKVETGDPCQE